MHVRMHICIQRHRVWSSEGNFVGSVLFTYLYLGPGNYTEAPGLLYKHCHPTEPSYWPVTQVCNGDHRAHRIYMREIRVWGGQRSWNLWNKVIARLLNLWARAGRPVCYEKLLGAKKISHQCGKFTTLYKWIQWTLIQPQKGKFFRYTYDMGGP